MRQQCNDRRIVFSSTAMSRYPWAVVLVLASFGCTRHVRLSPPLATAPNQQKLPLKAAVVIDSELLDVTDKLGHYSTLGIGNRWVVDTGSSVAAALEGTARAVFADVRVLSSRRDATADLYLYAEQPKVTRLDSAPYALRLTLRVVAKDKDGNIGLDQTYTRDVVGDGRPALNAGAFAGHQVLGAPLEQALASSLEQLGSDLRRALQ